MGGSMVTRPESSVSRWLIHALPRPNPPHTAAGGLLAVSMQQGFSTRTLGFSQGLSAGFMISVSVLEVLPEALRSLTIADAVAWVCIGSAVIYLLQVHGGCIDDLMVSVDRPIWLIGWLID